jgi:hypothetical protein
MSQTIDEIVEKIQELSDADKAELIHALIQGGAIPEAQEDILIAEMRKCEPTTSAKKVFEDLGRDGKL